MFMLGPHSRLPALVVPAMVRGHPPLVALRNEGKIVLWDSDIVSAERLGLERRCAQRCNDETHRIECFLCWIALFRDDVTCPLATCFQITFAPLPSDRISDARTPPKAHSQRGHPSGARPSQVSASTKPRLNEGKKHKPVAIPTIVVHLEATQRLLTMTSATIGDCLCARETTCRPRHPPQVHAKFSCRRCGMIRRTWFVISGHCHECSAAQPDYYRQSAEPGMPTL